MKKILSLLFALFTVNAFGQCSFPANSIASWDATTPADTDPAKCGASALREIKRSIQNTLTNTINLTTGQLLSNSIPSAAFTSNSIPFYSFSNGVSRSLGYVANGTYIGSTTIMKYNSIVPSNTQGQVVLTLTVTPSNSNSLLRVRAQVAGSVHGNSGNAAAAAIFTNSGVFALTAAGGNNTGSGGNDMPFVIPMGCDIISGTTTPLTFNVRAGPTGTATFNVNGDSTGIAFFGGVSSTFIEVEEIRQ